MPDIAGRGRAEPIAAHHPPFITVQYHCNQTLITFKNPVVGDAAGGNKDATAAEEEEEDDGYEYDEEEACNSID